MLSFEVERERLGFNIRDMHRKIYRKRTALPFSPVILEDTKQWTQITRQAVREEISRQNSNEQVTSVLTTPLTIQTPSSL